MLTPDAKKIRDLWKPGGKVDPAKEKHLRRAIKQAGAEEPSITYFLYHSDHRSKHPNVLEIVNSEGGK